MFKAYLTKRKLKKNVGMKGRELRVAASKSRAWKPLLMLIPAILILVLFTVVPFILVVRDGFHYKSINDIDNTSNGVWSFESFKLVAEDPYFAKAFKNSIIYAVLSVPLIIVISLLISSALSSLIRKRLRGIFQTIFFLPYVTSAVAISLSFAYIFDFDNGILNKIIGHKVPWLIDSKGHSGLWAFLIYGVWRGLAFNILIFTTAMLGVNKTLYKSASIDGAGGMRQFFKITIPSINKTINFLVLIGVIGAVKVFPLALFSNNASSAMANGGATLMLYIYDRIQAGAIQMASAASIYVLFISIGFSIVFKGGFNQLIKLGSYLEERHVSNKIKNTATKL